VLTAVLDRDGQLLSATQDRHRALANADHLAILHAIWTAETTPAREQRYKDMLSASLPPGVLPCSDTQVTPYDLPTIARLPEGVR